WVRIPDGSWLGVEPQATREAPWGWSDRLWHADEPSSGAWHGTPLAVFEALDWTRIDRIPALGEPARLPPGGGTAILNLIATLAAEQGAERLVYRGPYPTEQLFLALLESFRYEPASADPLATFMRGGLEWRPAPSERVFVADDLYVQLRERIEKVVWLEWGLIARDLGRGGRGRVRVWERRREALAGRLATAPARADRAALGLAVIAEMAALVGDELRGRAQAAILGLPPAAQPGALEGSGRLGPRGGAERARDIALAVDALLAEVAG